MLSTKVTRYVKNGIKYLVMTDKNISITLLLKLKSSLQLKLFSSSHFLGFDPIMRNIEGRFLSLNRKSV